MGNSPSYQLRRKERLTNLGHELIHAIMGCERFISWSIQQAKSWGRVILEIGLTYMRLESRNRNNYYTILCAKTRRRKEKKRKEKRKQSVQYGKEKDSNRRNTLPPYHIMN